MCLTTGRGCAAYTSHNLASQRGSPCLRTILLLQLLAALLLLTQNQVLSHSASDADHLPGRSTILVYSCPFSITPNSRAASRKHHSMACHAWSMVNCEQDCSCTHHWQSLLTCRRKSHQHICKGCTPRCGVKCPLLGGEVSNGRILLTDNHAFRADLRPPPSRRIQGACWGHKTAHFHTATRLLLLCEFEKISRQL